MRNPSRSSGWLGSFGALCVVVILSIVLVCPQAVFGRKKEPVKKDDVIDALISVNIKGTIEENRRQKMVSLTITATGKIKNESKAIGLNQYVPEGMNATYNYTYREIDLDPPQGCPPLALEEQGSGSVKVVSVKAGPSDNTGAFLLQVFTGPVGKTNMLQFTKRAGPDTITHLSKESASDNYTFMLAPVNMKITKKVRKKCPQYEYDEQDNKRVFALRVPFVELKQGKMSGSYSWNSKKVPYKKLGMEVTNVRGNITYDPKKEPGDVQYQVNWNFGKPKPMVEIRWEEKDVTDQHQDVVVGERIKLKAVVYPEDKDPKKGQWTIQGKFIEDFVVRGQEGKIDKLEGDELKKPEIKFHWWDKGENLTVNYTTKVDGEDLKAKTTFLVKKPMITLKAETPRGTPGCWEVKDKDVYSHYELVYYVPNSPTIKFSHSGIPAEFPGETQYVQLVLVKGHWIKKEDALYPHCLDVNKEGLDGQYPYSSNPEAYDTPGVPVSFLYDKDLNINYSFNMYLMFKSSKQGAIFVPLRVIDWVWTGDYKWNEKTKESICEVTRTEAPKDKAAEKYPEWTKISERGKEGFKECK
jgi:hypothetical protein